SKEGKSPLHMAAIHGRFTRSQILIQNGSEIDCADKYGNTPLHVAARYGHELLISTLMTNGADTARTPLHYAAANGSYQCTVTLVTAGAAVNEADGKGCTALHYAAASDTYRRAEAHSGPSEEEPLKESRLKEAFFCLEFLLDNGADPSLRDKQGYTAVHYAAAYGNRQNLELLLEMSFNCLEDVESTVPVSPLHLAAYNGHCEALKALAETLVNLDVRDHKGRTALYLATERGASECVQVLTSHGASALVKERKRKWTPLHAAAANGNTDSLHLLIDSGERADITDVMDIHGHFLVVSIGAVTGCEDCLAALLDHDGSAVTGCEDCLAALLDHDAFVLCRDFKGRTPIHFASACGHLEALRALLRAALATDPLDAGVDYSGYSPMHWASYSVFFGSLMDYSGYSPMHWASYSEFLLFQAKANITVLDVNKNTALHLACSKGHEKCALLILGETQDLGLINASNSALQMPLHIAARNGLASVVQALLSRGATVLAVDEEGACAPGPWGTAESWGAPRAREGLSHSHPDPACGALPVPARGALPVPACGALPNGSSCPYSKERHSAIGLDGCYSE
ncbi:serine/threonine-protein phosphatase 6 regulatory ankyrin repeat subunit C-like, partial [Passer montanus]|uniref:serine/threonine-protein phosphatase 6 regulatory ankyrin repeat subunit C-like n=1 Tax=Passer montanus TaxID=9160 RepID=UPI0019606E0D